MMGSILKRTLSMKKTGPARLTSGSISGNTRLACALGLATFLEGPLLGINAAAVRPILDGIVGEQSGAVIATVLAIPVICLTPAALIAGIRALKAGERSWPVWTGFIPAVLSVVFWGMMIAGEFLLPH